MSEYRSVGQADAAGEDAGRAQRGPYRPRTRGVDPCRRLAYDVLRQVSQQDAYANLLLPQLLRERGIRGRDAAFTTELTYGTLRLQGRYDAIISLCSDRPLAELDDSVKLLLRLGIHQLLSMRVPPHAAVSETVAVARVATSDGPARTVNAVLRCVSEKSNDEWLAELEKETDEVKRLSAVYSHPAWIVRGLKQALLANGRQAEEITQVLKANNVEPSVMMVARPGLISPEELLAEASDYLGGQVEFGQLSPYAVLLAGGNPGQLPALRTGQAGVQDEGSQLVATLLAKVEIGPGTDDLWLDLCAGPGGKAALLGALAAQKGARLVANEVAPHRANLVLDTTEPLKDHVEVVNQDGREFGKRYPEEFDRILVDAPCTGLGALRRRPEARFRRTPADLADLSKLQEELLASAWLALRPGGVLAYVTCSPHFAETHSVVDKFLSTRPEAEVIRPGDTVTNIVTNEAMGSVGQVPMTGKYLQLWPDLHQVDAMFCALIKKNTIPAGGGTATDKPGLSNTEES